MVSGDGFNDRYEHATASVPDKVRCVDDTALWTEGDDVKSHFLRMCEYLHSCASSGIVLNPDKFQFCQDQIEFAGLKVSKTNLMPSDKMLEAIRNFPKPTDITGVRAWFGLVNQAAYAFAMTEEMAPFRHLLSPKQKFQWSDELDRLFEKAKVAIVDKVEEGVRLFDQNLPTSLATDFSGKGIGFFLLQKTCDCQSKLPTCCAGGWRVCLIGSRFLHDAEQRYAPIEGEALAIVYGLHQCRYFIQGCPNLSIITDHKPLLHVFNDRSLADMENRRLQNLKEKTLSFKFDIVHIPGKEHKGPDAASRYPVGPPERLVLPGEPPEADIGQSIYKRETRHRLLDNLATVEEVKTHHCLKRLY